MKRIFKYKLENVDQQTINVPFPARILSVEEQNDDIVLYAVADDGEGVPTTPVDIVIIGTGDAIQIIDIYTFVGTVKLYGGKEMWHVFYRYIDPFENVSDRLGERIGERLVEKPKLVTLSISK